MHPSSSLGERLAVHNIDEFTISVLRAGKDFVMAELPAVLDRFYEHFGRFETTRSFFRDRQHMSQAREAQLRHWALLLEAKFDGAYFKSSTIVGETHNRIGLKPSLYIAGYNILTAGLVEAVHARFPSSALAREGISRTLKQRKIDAKTAMTSAIVQAAVLDMDLAISVYSEAEARDRTEMLQRLSDEFEASMASVVDGVAQSAKALHEAADSMIGMTGQTASQSGDIANAAELTSANVNTVAAATEELSASVVEITRQVAASADIAQQAVNTSNVAYSKVDELATASQTIGSIVEVINAIARQTNLLALNATIEAARAGEAGKGFSVVANEVKSLASQTAKATSEIEGQVRGIQEATRDTLASIQSISEVINSIHSVSNTIAAAVEQQGAATSEISRNVSEAATGTDRVSERIMELNSVADSTQTSAGQVMASAKNLGSQAENLQTVTKQFLASIRQGTRSKTAA